MVPPADRCKYRTLKEPTGPFNRKKLLDFLAKKAREDKDWEEIKPYIKEVRGRQNKPVCHCTVLFLQSPYISVVVEKFYTISSLVEFFCSFCQSWKHQ